MTSIVIAAHNEAAVIGRCLDTILRDAAPGEFDITVVANGCADDTARVAAARPGVRVLDLAAAGKTAALNAGDAAAHGFPRLYLDADVVVSAADVRALVAALRRGPRGEGPLAVMPGAGSTSPADRCWSAPSMRSTPGCRSTAMPCSAAA